MRVGVVDVGSNTVRLLVASDSGGGIVREREERTYLRLGEQIVRRGALSGSKLEEAASVAQRYARLARKEGARAVEIVVTAPGRQAENGDELLHVLAQATRLPVRVLTAEAEGALAYAGAVAAAHDLPDTVAVCDMGGGSTEIAVGAPPGGPSWVRSVDLGALRLTEACLEHDPPTPEEVSDAAERTAASFAGITPPRPQAAIVVGGSARALAKLVGERLGEAELDAAVVLASRHKASKVAKAFGIDEERAHVLPAGAIVLAEVTRRLGVALELGRGGLREGAAAQLLASTRAATSAAVG